MVERGIGIGRKKKVGVLYLEEVKTSRIHINQYLSRACCGLWNVCGERDIRRVGKLFHYECPHSVSGLVICEQFEVYMFY